MQKGDETKYGVYLGERTVEREKRLTPAEVAKLPKVYKEREPADGPSVFAETALAHVFEKSGKEVVIRFEDFKV